MTKQPTRQQYKCDMCKAGELLCSQLGLGMTSIHGNNIPINRRVTTEPEQMANHDCHLCKTCLSLFKSVI